MSSFYIIATPIGNLSEISKRAIDAFKKADIIFCEDTRVTKKLLLNLGIEFNTKKFIINNLQTEHKNIYDLNVIKNNNCCLVSDAGYPLISDPGFNLISFLDDNKIKYEVINGPCSIIHALLISKMKTNNFFFFGFLNQKPNLRKQELINIKKNIKSTIILFESVHRLKQTLNDILQVFGDIKISVCKELTKLNEKVYNGNISQIINQIEFKGEFVIVFENLLKENNSTNDDEILFELNMLAKKGIDKKTATKMVAYKHNIKANNLYDKIKNLK